MTMQEQRPIHVLSSKTINRIAAGEVVEKPVNVVKELVENAIDAGSSAITVEIRGGGAELIRVTDNGCGIEASQISNAFRRHATSKIEDEEDLMKLSSLGFRGEALSSIAAVSDVEMITRTPASLVGSRAVNVSRAGVTKDETPLEISEVGAPAGTTVIVRNLFYNVPVRKKFLKSAQTEAGYITDIMEQMALSHPDISFHYRVNGQEKLHTTGNGNEKELIYRIYGREMANSVIPIQMDTTELAQILPDAQDALRERLAKAHYRIGGFLGRPEFSRSSRNFEIFFINGRILRSDVLSKALEEGYRTDLMQHRFPFAILHLEMPAQEIDVNVHPAKKEVRFAQAELVYSFINEAVHSVLHKVELIPKATLDTFAEKKAADVAEQRQREQEVAAIEHIEQFEQLQKPAAPEPVQPFDGLAEAAGNASQGTDAFFTDRRKPVQMSFFAEQRLPEKKPQAVMESPAEYHTDSAEEEPFLLTKKNAPEFRIVGQIFGTYWLIEFQDQLLIIDQHAAHEKVNFERLMARLENRQKQDMENGQVPAQLLSPPIIIQLSGREEGAYLQFQDVFHRMGYEIEEFGAGSYAIRAVPLELYANQPDALIHEILEEILSERIGGTPSAILYKIASMSCKAAVKGNSLLSEEEARELISQLLSLDNPYHCPHGRPTMIVMDQSEMDRKFKRIV